MNRPLLPRKGVYIGTRFLFDQSLADSVKVTLLQLMALTYGSGSHSTPPLTYDLLFHLTGKSARSLRGHFLALRAYHAVLRLQRAGAGQFIISLADWLFDNQVGIGPAALDGLGSGGKDVPGGENVPDGKDMPGGESLPVTENLPDGKIGTIHGAVNINQEDDLNIMHKLNSENDVFNPHPNHHYGDGGFARDAFSGAFDTGEGALDDAAEAAYAADEAYAADAAYAADDDADDSAHQRANKPGRAREDAPGRRRSVYQRGFGLGRGNPGDTAREDTRGREDPRESPRSREVSHPREDSRSHERPRDADWPKGEVLSLELSARLRDAGVFPSLFGEIAGRAVRDGYTDDELDALLDWCILENATRPGGLFMVRLRAGARVPGKLQEPPCPRCGQRGSHDKTCPRRYLIDGITA